MTQTIYFGTTCPKAGFGEAPQQALLRPTRDAKIASVATLALLAVSAYPQKGAKNGGCVFSHFLRFPVFFDCADNSLDQPQLTLAERIE